MIEVSVDAPPEVRRNVIAKMTENGFIRRIERKTNLGLHIATEEIEENINILKKKKSLKTDQLKKYEKICDFLQKNEMQYTLDCFTEEMEGIYALR